MRIELNPDNNFVRNKRKENKNNNGYCKEVKEEMLRYKQEGRTYPHDKKNMKCMCEKFANQTCAGWCMGDLYVRIIEEGDPNYDTSAEGR